MNAAKKPIWKRPVYIAGLLLVLIAGLLVGWLFYTKSALDKELQNAIAEADRLDPGWRLEELEAKRAVIPVGDNSAEEIVAIKGLLPTPWPSPSFTKPPKSEEAAWGPDDPPDAMEVALMELPPEVQLSPDQTRQLRLEMESVKEPLAKARALVNFRRGRFTVNWSVDYISTVVPCQYCRTVMDLLSLDARLRAQDGDIEGALTSVLCIVSTGGSIGDEPTLLSQLVRMGGEGLATNTLERVLAQGHGSSNSLANVQHVFEDEASQPLFLFGVRGERAGHHQMISAIESGELKVSSVTASLLRTSKGKLEGWWEDLSGEIELRRSHGPWIRVMTEVVEIAKLPIEEQRPRLRSYGRSIDKEAGHGKFPVYIGLLVPSMIRVGESFYRNQALLRCAVVGLAAERYRIGHGHWPDSLSALVPEFLEKVPLDPYDAKPLRYRRLKDGVLMYSVGPDEQDNGGKLDREDPRKPGTDIGFQLWDVNSRRQPWRPPAKKTVPPDDD
jgi:hypothetical protein